MSDFKVEGPVLKKTILFARRGPISFAYNPAKQTADDYFGLHRKKKPLALRMDAKKNGEGAKVAFGTATLEGKLLSLQLEGAPLPSMAKKLKKYFKTQRLVLNVQILDETGAVLEADVEDLPPDPSIDDAPMEDDDAGDATEALTAEEMESFAAEAAEVAPEGDDDEVEPAPTAPEGDALAIARRLEDLLEELRGLPDAVAAKLTEAVRKAEGYLKAGDLAVAAASAEKIASVLAQLRPEVPAAPAAGSAALSARCALLRAQAEKLPEDHGARPKILAALDQADGRIAAAELDVAGIILDKVSEALTRAAMGEEREKGGDGEAEWKKARARVEPAVNEALRTGAMDTARLQNAWSVLLDQAEKKQDYAKALAGLAKLEAALKQAGVPVPDPVDEAPAPAAAAGGEDAAWRAAVAALEPAYIQAVSTGQVAEPDKLRMAWEVAQQTADKGDYAKARQILDRIEARIKAAAPAPAAAADTAPAGATDTAPAGAADAAPAGTAAPDAQRISAGAAGWGRARQTMQAEIAKLEAAILAAIGDDPELAPVKRELPALGARLAAFDGGLEEALDALASAADPDEMTRQQRRAAAIVKEYRTLLGSDFFADVDSNNGFVALKLRAAADEALGRIEPLLAA